MTLRAGCRLVVAPMFQLPVDWSARLQVGSIAQADWRAPQVDELAFLLPDGSRPLPREHLSDCLCLFRLPQHLLAAWWRVLALLNEAGSLPADEFNAFARAVGRFLTFKEMPLPEQAAVDLLVSQPGQRSVSQETDGLQFWGGINLGDEATTLVFNNLPARELPAALDYPLVRLRIEPGEGFRLPASGLLAGVCTLDKREPDVLLRVRRRSAVEGSA